MPFLHLTQKLKHVFPLRAPFQILRFEQLLPPRHRPHGPV
jgi:hypothetical protein